MIKIPSENYFGRRPYFCAHAQRDDDTISGKSFGVGAVRRMIILKYREAGIEMQTLESFTNLYELGAYT